MKRMTFSIFLFFMFCLLPLSSSAADKVVVVPLGKTTSPAGSDGQIQYNDNGGFSGSEMTYDKNTGDVKLSNELHSSSTGTTNMLPIAYGKISDNGVIYSGTGNFTCSWNAGSDRYEISIDGESYYYQDYVTLVTATGSRSIASTSSMGGDLLVYFDDHAGNPQQVNFNFITYKP